MSKKKQKYFILCVDLEKFLVPNEFDQEIVEEEISRISFIGAEKVIHLLKEQDIKATFFITIDMALDHPHLIKYLKKEGHEIALHYDVSSGSYSQVQADKKKLEHISGAKVIGFRAHRFEDFPPEVLKEYGFVYNNSIHPTFVPGRYCHIFKSTKISQEKGFFSVPASVTPFLRLPYSWVWFRNLGVHYAKFCTWWTYLEHDMVNIYFHNWDFEDVTNNKMKRRFRFVFRNTGDRCIKQLSVYIKWLKKNEVIFSTFQDYLRKK